MAARTDKIHGLVEEIYKNLGDNFTPATRQLVTAGRAYMRTLTASNNAAKVYYEAVSKVGQSAGERWGITKDIGSALMEIADLHRDLHIQTSMMLKSFNLDYINVVDAMLEQDLKNVQGEYKKYHSGNRFHTDAYDKAMTQLKKQRKKTNRTSAIGSGGILKHGIMNGGRSNSHLNGNSNKTYSSIDGNLDTIIQDGSSAHGRRANGGAPDVSNNNNKEMEMKHVWQLNELGKQLDDFRVQSVKMAYVNEKQCYTKILEKHCNRIQCMVSECHKIIMLFQQKMDRWAPLYNRNNIYHSPELEKIIEDNLKLSDRTSVIYDVTGSDHYPTSQTLSMNGSLAYAKPNNVNNNNNSINQPGISHQFYGQMGSNGTGQRSGIPPPNNHVYGTSSMISGSHRHDFQSYAPYGKAGTTDYYGPGLQHQTVLSPYESQQDTYDYLYSSSLSLMSAGGLVRPAIVALGGPDGGILNTNVGSKRTQQIVRAGNIEAIKCQASGRNSSSSSSGIVSGGGSTMGSCQTVGASNGPADGSGPTYEGRSVSEVYAERGGTHSMYSNPSDAQQGSGGTGVVPPPQRHVDQYGPPGPPNPLNHGRATATQAYYDGYGPSQYSNGSAPILHNGKTLVKALYPYHRNNDNSASSNTTYDTNQLDLNEGDVVALTPGVLKNGWHFGENLNSGKNGWFPLSFTEGIDVPPLVAPPPEANLQGIYKTSMIHQVPDQYGVLQKPGSRRTEIFANDNIPTISKMNYSRSEHDLLTANDHDVDGMMMRKQNSINHIDNHWPATAVDRRPSAKNPMMATILGRDTPNNSDTYAHVRITRPATIIYETPATILAYGNNRGSAAPYQDYTGRQQRGPNQLIPQSHPSNYNYAALAKPGEPSNQYDNRDRNQMLYRYDVKGGVPLEQPQFLQPQHHQRQQDTEVGEGSNRRKRDKSLENIQKQQHLLLMANAASEPRSPSSASVDSTKLSPTTFGGNASTNDDGTNINLNIKLRPRTPIMMASSMADTSLPKVLEVMEAETGDNTINTECENSTATVAAMNSQLVDRELDKRANLFSELKDRLKKRGADSVPPANTKASAPGIKTAASVVAIKTNGHVVVGSSGPALQKRTSILYRGGEGNLIATPPVPPTPPPLPPPNKL